MKRIYNNFDFDFDMIILERKDTMSKLHEARKRLMNYKPRKMK